MNDAVAINLERIAILAISGASGCQCFRVERGVKAIGGHRAAGTTNAALTMEMQPTLLWLVRLLVVWENGSV